MAIFSRWTCFILCFSLFLFHPVMATLNLDTQGLKVVRVYTGWILLSAKFVSLINMTVEVQNKKYRYQWKPMICTFMYSILIWLVLLHFIHYFWNFEGRRNWKFEKLKFPSILYLQKISFFGKVMQWMSRAWTNIENGKEGLSFYHWSETFHYFTIFHVKIAESNCCQKSFFEKYGGVWTAKDSNLRQNYEPVLTWHKMCISEVSVMANKSIVRHPQAKLLMKQIWHSIKFTLYIDFPQVERLRNSK